MDDLITDGDQITPDWLTRVLQKEGCINQAEVIMVQKSSWSTTTSIISRLELSYSDDAPKSAPSQLFLKISKPDVSSRFGKKEVRFYNTIADAMIDSPLVRCYDAVYSPKTGKSHLLLDDLSETHFQAEFPLPPCKPQCEQVIDCLAGFHAFWWEHPRLGKDIGELPTENSIRNYIVDIEKTLPGFMDFLGDRLSIYRRRLYKRALSSLSSLLRHLTEGKNLTLSHGDAGLKNFLYPYNPDKDKVRIIDWQFWNINVGVNDLAFMIALQWYPERRRSMEGDLLRRYHDELLQHGVEGYGWDDCWYDYRVMVIHNLFTPVWQWSAKLRPGIWWPNLESIVLAFQDLEGAELFEN